MFVFLVEKDLRWARQIYIYLDGRGLEIRKKAPDREMVVEPKDGKLFVCPHFYV